MPTLMAAWIILTNLSGIKLLNDIWIFLGLMALMPIPFDSNVGLTCLEKGHKFIIFLC